MASRIDLHNELLGFSNNVYYQPPENIKIKYPCIIYNKKIPDVKKADNKTYMLTNRYEITYVTKDVENTVCDDILNHFEMISPVNYFVTEGLYHYIFNLYY